MEQNVEINVLKFDGKDYFLMDSVTEENIYYYFSNIKDANDIIVLKGQGDNFISLDSDSERDYALSLFFEKHKDEHFE